MVLWRLSKIPVLARFWTSEPYSSQFTVAKTLITRLDPSSSSVKLIMRLSQLVKKCGKLKFDANFSRAQQGGFFWSWLLITEWSLYCKNFLKNTEKPNLEPVKSESSWSTNLLDFVIRVATRGKKSSKSRRDFNDLLRPMFMKIPEDFTVWLQTRANGRIYRQTWWS